jgi:RNA polymerase sigma-70 factor (ECF subfamily)
MRDGPGAWLTLIDALLARGQLTDYPLAHSARADLWPAPRPNRHAVDAYRRALLLTTQTPQRRCLERRIAELTGA